MNAQAKSWASFAREDLRSAELLLGAGIWNQVCFHSQQCVEKLLKAVIAESGGTIPQVHALARLLRLVSPAASAALAPVATDVISLDRFYIPTRYPDALPGTLPSGLPTEQDANSALAVAKAVTSIVEALLR